MRRINEPKVLEYSSTADGGTKNHNSFRRVLTEIAWFIVVQSVTAAAMIATYFAYYKSGLPLNWSWLPSVFVGIVVFAATWFAVRVFFKA